VETPYLSWQVLARRQWPLALALAFFLSVEAYSRLSRDAYQWWELPGSLIIVGLAVLAPRRPFDAALTMAVVLVASTVLLWALGVYAIAITGMLMLSEFGSVMATIAIVCRHAGRLWAVLGTSALLAATTFTATLRLRPSYHHSSPLSPSELLICILLVTLSIGTGLYFRNRDRERERSEATSIAAAQQAERLALARELHDVVAHYVTGIVVHAQAAELVVDTDPEAARSALPIITASGNEALTAMRRLVGTLRGAEPVGTTSKDNEELAAQVTQLVERTGGPIRLAVELTDPVPPTLGRSVIRLVQESLTNVHKHAAGMTRIDVDVRAVGSVLTVLVADDGTGQQHDPAGGSGGYGLVGMRERVELLGGRFSAGPRGDRGWQVSAELPVVP
jgi:signal transduction histidine kinase